MGKLIYTYKKGLHHIPSVLSDDDIVKIYKECIKNNNKFHQSVMYTTREHATLFEDVVDSVIIVSDSLDIYFQDDLKFYVLENESVPFTLIDGDIILDNELIIGNQDVVFEKKIKDNKNDDYFLKMITHLTNYKINNILPYWKVFNHTYNLGIVHVNNNAFVNKFISEYNKLKTWYKETVHKVNPSIKNDFVIEMATCTYFLSMFLELNKFSIGVLNETNSFTHYSGLKEKIKFLKSIGQYKQKSI